MADLSNLSDSELTALYNQNAGSAAAPTDVTKMSDDQLKQAYEASKAQPPAPSSGVVDFLKSIPRGMLSGLSSMTSAMGQAEAPLSGVNPEEVPNAPQETKILEKNVTGDLPKPEGTAGRYGAAVGEFLGNPGTYLGPGGIVPKAITAVGSAVGSEAAGDLANKFAPDSPKTQMTMKLLGAIAGGHGINAAPRLITPNIISAERQAMVNTLDQEGIPLTAGDRTGGTTLKAAESELSPGVNEAQRQAFEQAAFNRVGEHIGDRPIQGQAGAVNTMMNRVGGQFDTLTARNRVDPDMQLVQELNNIRSTYNDVPGLYPQETVNSVNGSIDRVMHTMFNNPRGFGMSGPDYQTLRSNLRSAAQGATDPQRAEGLHGVTNALDDAMERTIQRTNPVDAGAFAQARRDYRNALVLQRWAGSANMTPSTLAQAAKAVYGKNQYVRGMDDFSDLAESGRNVMKQYQDSGTARRLQIEGILKGLGGVAGFGAGAVHEGGPGAGAAEGGVAGLLLGELAGPMVARPAARAALMNPVTQGILSNQVLPYRFETSPGTMALINAIGGNNVGAPPVQGARKASDGKWYIPDKSRPGKYLEVRP